MKDRNTAIAQAMQVEGLLTEGELKIMSELLPDVPYPRVFETGSWKGRSATLWHWLGAITFTVDDWSGNWAIQSDPSENLKQFVEHTSPEITALKANTITEHDKLLTAVTLIFSVRKADLVFIDCDHSTKGVLLDVELAQVAIRPGGVICGHDVDFPEVQAALKESFGDRWEALSAKLWRAT